jgi:hypothetical protein
MRRYRHHQRRRWPQILRILAPFWLLLLCLGALQLAPSISTSRNITPVVSSSTPAPPPATLFPETTPSVAMAATAALTTATQAPAAALSPTPSTTATPPIPPEAQIQLLGPPAKSVLDISETASFYWLWPIALADDQAFAVYVFVEGQPYLLGQIDEPNMGQAYRLHFVLQDLAPSAVAIEWQVVLMTVPDGTVIRQSELRSLNLSPTIP